MCADALSEMCEEHLLMHPGHIGLPHKALPSHPLLLRWTFLCIFYFPFQMCPLLWAFPSWWETREMVISTQWPNHWPTYLDNEWYSGRFYFLIISYELDIVSQTWLRLWVQGGVLLSFIPHSVQCQEKVLYKCLSSTTKRTFLIVIKSQTFWVWHSKALLPTSHSQSFSRWIRTVMLTLQYLQWNRTHYAVCHPFHFWISSHDWKLPLLFLSVSNLLCSTLSSVVLVILSGIGKNIFQFHIDSPSNIEGSYYIYSKS